MLKLCQLGFAKAGSQVGEVVEEEEEEEVVKVEREVDVEKSNIRAMKVVCSLCVHEDVNKE